MINIYKYFIFLTLFFSFSFSMDKKLFTKEELSWIKNNPTISIAMLNNFQPFSYYSKVQHKGFTVDVLKKIEEISGLKFKIKTSQWSKAIKSFRNKEVDVISDVSYIKKRDKYILFTKPYYEIPTFIFGLKSDDDYIDNSSLKGKTVAVIKDIFYIDKLKENGVKIYEVNTSLQKAQAVVTNKADYFMASFTTGQKAITDNTFFTLKVIDEYSHIKKEDLRLGIQKDKPILQKILNKAIDDISFEDFDTLAKKWVNNNYYNSKRVNFNKEELTYIRNNPVLKYSETNWKPLSIIENNTMKGIMGDYLEIIAQRTGFKFQYIPSKNWEDVLKMFKEKKSTFFLELVQVPKRKN